MADVTFNTKSRQLKHCQHIDIVTVFIVTLTYIHILNYVQWNLRNPNSNNSLGSETWINRLHRYWDI